MYNLREIESRYNMALEHLDDQRNKYYFSPLLYQFMSTKSENLVSIIFITEQFINYHMQCNVLCNIQDIPL
jgi:hypothetical protein